MSRSCLASLNKPNWLWILKVNTFGYIYSWDGQPPPKIKLIQRQWKQSLLKHNCNKLTKKLNDIWSHNGNP
jgi:hypothetical protein